MLVAHILLKWPGNALDVAVMLCSLRLALQEGRFLWTACLESPGTRETLLCGSTLSNESEPVAQYDSSQTRFGCQQNGRGAMALVRRALLVPSRRQATAPVEDRSQLVDSIMNRIWWRPDNGKKILWWSKVRETYCRRCGNGNGL